MKNLSLNEIEQVSGGKFSITEFAYYAEAGALAGALAAKYILGSSLISTTAYGALAGVGVGLINNTATYVDKTFLNQ